MTQVDVSSLQSDVKTLARIVRSFVNGGLTVGDFRELDALVRGETIEPSGQPHFEYDDRDLDFEYVDANGKRVDATGAVFERRRRFFRLFMGR